MASTDHITQAQVRELFDYRDDGQLIHRNGSKVGKIAGTESRGYRLVRLGNVLYRVHRLVFLWHHGHMPKEIDHVNGNGLDNRIENLRSVTRSQNNWNRRGILGASRHGHKWRAHINVNNRQQHLGVFDTREAAHAAYVAAKKRLHTWES